MLRLGLGLALSLMSPLCWAGATLTMGFGSDSGCTTADNCAFHPNVGMSGSASISQNGSQDVPPPILLILGVLNDTAGNLFNTNPIGSMWEWLSFNPAAPADGRTECTAPGCWSYSGSSSLGALGYRGSFSGGNVYSFLGLSGGNSSNNFPNWSGFLASEYGVPASSFGIYVIALNTTLQAGGLIEVEFSSPLPDYTYFAGYATNGSQVFSSPFTRTGLQVAVPEPSFWMLLCFDLLCLGGGIALAASFQAKLRRKRLHAPAVS